MEYSIDELNSEEIIIYRCLVDIIENNTQKKTKKEVQF